MSLTLPNALTIGRLIAAPGPLLCLLTLPHPAAAWAALAVFAAAAITDALDGWLARRLNQETALGATLDPIADKALTALTLLGLCAVNPPTAALVLPAAAILLRETLVTGLREALSVHAASQERALPSTWLAKVKTAAQMTALALALVGLPHGDAAALPPPAAIIALSMLWIAAVLTLITGWDYLNRAVIHLTKAESRP